MGIIFKGKINQYYLLKTCRLYLELGTIVRMEPESEPPIAKLLLPIGIFILRNELTQNEQTQASPMLELILKKTFVFLK